MRVGDLYLYKPYIFFSVAGHTTFPFIQYPSTAHTRPNLPGTAPRRRRRGRPPAAPPPPSLPLLLLLLPPPHYRAVYICYVWACEHISARMRLSNPIQSHMTKSPYAHPPAAKTARSPPHPALLLLPRSAHHRRCRCGRWRRRRPPGVGGRRGLPVVLVLIEGFGGGERGWCCCRVPHVLSFTHINIHTHININISIPAHPYVPAAPPA